MPLSDREIRKSFDRGLVISPFNPDHLQPASYDVTLDSAYRVPRHDMGCIDVAEVPEGHTLLLEDDYAIPLEPGDFLLASTVERIELPGTMVARIEGRSSLGRLGVLIHSTAGFIDPGFRGQVTLEISNIAPWEIILRPGMRIGQLAFEYLGSSPDRLYGNIGHYQDQQGPQESRLRLD